MISHWEKDNMPPKYLVAILVLLTLAVPASHAQAGGAVSICDEAHLRAALAGGGTVTFVCSGTIILTATIIIGTNTNIDGSGQTIIISGNHRSCHRELRDYAQP